MSNPLDRVLADARASVTAAAAPVARSQEVVGGARSVVERLQQRVAAAYPGADVHVKQSIQAGTVSDAVQSVSVSTALEPRYFGVAVYPPADASGADLPALVLEPGTTYRVRIRAGDNPATPSHADYVQHGVRVRRDVRLFLEVGAIAVGESAAVNPEVVEYSADAEAAWAEERVLVVPHGFRDGSLLLRLRYQEPGAGETSVATTRRLPVRTGAGAFVVAPPVVHAVDARCLPPARTAVLHLTRVGGDQVMAAAFLPERADRPALVPFDAPLAPAGPFARSVDFLRALSECMDDFSMGSTGGIGPWLEEVLRLYGEDCALLVTDDSGSSIPWELFLLEDGSRLGARARVVRWMSLVHRDRPVAWETAPLCLPGRLAAYVHSDAASTALAGAPLLTRAAAICSDGDDLCNVLLDATDRGEPVGLVYLAACAGLAHDATEEAALRALDPAPPSTARLRLGGLEGRLPTRPLVFVNAPYSGRSPSSVPGGGLARALLVQVASGYIGTIGPVDVAQAASFAEMVLSTAHGEEFNPAERLRVLRSQAMEVFLNRRLSHDERRAALVAFLYVYYGNPHLRIPAEVTHDR